MPKEQPSYFGISSADSRYDKRLVPNEKLMTIEINALSNKWGYCTANNRYFAELYNVRKGTVSLWISELKKYGYITVEYIRKDNQIIQRRIYENNNPIQKKQGGIQENHNTHSEKSDGGYSGNPEHPIQKNLKDNNTRVNNTSNNNTRKNNSDRSSDFSDIHEALSFYQNNIGMISPYQADKLQSYASDFSSEMIIEAIKVALNKNVKSINYITGVLNRWNDKNIHSIEQKKADDLEHKQKFSNNSNRSEYTGQKINQDNVDKGDLPF